jgi:hypothetical protein
LNLDGAEEGTRTPHPCEYVDLNHARLQFRHFGTVLKV